MNQGLPNNIEAEKALIGSVFWSYGALQKACEEVDKDMFYLDSHAKIFEVILELYQNKKPVDINTLTTELVNKKLINTVGGVEYLNEITDSVATGANIEYYINTVVEKYTLRRMIEVATNIIKVSNDPETDVSAAVEQAEKNILNVGKFRRTTEFRKVQDVLTKAEEDLETLSKNKGRITGLTTGLIDLDNLTEGLKPTQLIIIAARPAVGKTAFALNIAQNVALKTNTPVAIFSLEMSKEQLMQRMLCSEAEIDSQRVKTGNMQSKDWEKLANAMNLFAQAPIYIDDTSGSTITDIRAKCRRLKMEEKNLGLVLIDYLQLMESSSREDRMQQISAISRGLKILARELDVPVIALSQLSRAVESRTDKRPMLSDLRESGAIEQDADIVMFIYRDEYYKKADEDDEVSKASSKGESEIIIAKHRNGSVGTIKLLFQGNITKFKNPIKTDAF